MDSKKLSTYERAQEQGLQRGAIAVAPRCEGFTLARVFGYQWQYVMVRYPNGAVRGYVPEILAKTTEAQAAVFWEQMRVADPERYAWHAETEQSRSRMKARG